MFLTAFSIILLLFWTGVSAYLVLNTRKIHYLKNMTPLPDANCPSLAIVIAVKDEEAEVEEALQSVCQLD